MYTTRPDLDRSGWVLLSGSFMDQVEVESEAGVGTIVRMKKTIGQTQQPFCIKGGPMERTLRLIQRAHEGDKEARDILVEENVGLVWSIVRRFKTEVWNRKICFQIGTIGLIKAVDKFDCSYEVCFSTYAVPMIAGEIKRYLRDDGILKVSRSLKETAGKAYRIREQQEKQTGREPTVRELPGTGNPTGGTDGGDGVLCAGGIPAADNLPGRRQYHPSDRQTGRKSEPE